MRLILHTITGNAMFLFQFWSITKPTEIYAYTFDEYTIDKFSKPEQII